MIDAKSNSNLNIDRQYITNTLDDLIKSK